MTPQIGFVLLTHNHPEQVLRLVRRLIVLYDNPPIAIHHDFGKCKLTPSDFPAEASFVIPHLNTTWARLSLVEASRAALRKLYDRPDSPEWFVLLSGADYPVRAPDLVLRELREGGCDAYLDHRLIDHPHVPGPDETAGHGHRNPRWVTTAYERYVSLQLWFPWVSLERRKLRKIKFKSVFSPKLAQPFTPFSDEFRCYGGEFWFTGKPESRGTAAR